MRPVIRRKPPEPLPAARPGSDSALTVIGIDPSLSSTGYSYRSNGKLVTGRITTGDMRGPRRLHYVRSAIGRVLDDALPDFAVIEDYAMGARGNNMFHIGELGGVLKCLLWERGIDYIPVPPTVLKSVIALSGRAEKPQIIEALRKRFGLSVPLHDEADAAGLMLLGEMRCGFVAGGKSSAELKRFDAVRKVDVVRGMLKIGLHSSSKPYI